MAQNDNDREIGRLQGQMESLKGRVNWLYGIIAGALGACIAYLVGKG